MSVFFGVVTVHVGQDVLTGQGGGAIVGGGVGLYPGDELLFVVGGDHGAAGLAGALLR